METYWPKMNENGSVSVKAASIAGSSSVSLIASQTPSTVASILTSLSLTSRTSDKENRYLRLPRSNTNDFNTIRMANLVRERTMDSQAYYKRVAFLPLKIRQVTFLNEDLNGYNGSKTMMGTAGHGKSSVNQTSDQWKKDIDRQVHSWMKSKPVDNQHLTPRSLLSPTFDGPRKRRQKRHRLREIDDSTMETAESVIGGSESLVSVSTDYTKQSSVDTKISQSSLFAKTAVLSKGGTLSRSSDDLLDVGKQHGSAYNEIEYQKRYRRIFDLKKHLHFVNSTCLAGQNILKKAQRLPPMNGFTKEEMDLCAPDLLAISSVQKHNEPDTVVRYPAPTLVTTTQLTTHISPDKDFGDSHNSIHNNLTNHSTNTSDTRQQSTRKTELNIFDKLPRITGKGQRRPGVEHHLTISDYRVLRETEIRNRRHKRPGRNVQNERKFSVIEEGVSKCNTHRFDRDDMPGGGLSGVGLMTNVGDRTEEQDDPVKEEAKEEEQEEDTDDQYEQTPGMKIRIHIKYKRDLDDTVTAEDSTDNEDVMTTHTSQHSKVDGRLPVKHRTYSKKKSVRQVSE